MNRNENLKVRTPYERNRTITLVQDESLTHQSFKDECDMGNIINRFFKGAPVHHLNPSSPIYDRAPDMDLHTAMCLRVDAEQRFAGLDDDERRKYNDDPLEFLAAELSGALPEGADSAQAPADPQSEAAAAPPQASAPAEPSPPSRSMESENGPS